MKVIATIVPKGKVVRRNGQVIFIPAAPIGVPDE